MPAAGEMMSIMELEDLAEEKAKSFKNFIEAQPPTHNGEDLLKLWEEVYDEAMQSVVVQTTIGASDDETDPVYPYEKLQAVIKDGGNWKWPRMWQRFDEIERRGGAFREGERLNFNMPDKNPSIVPQRVLVVGGGPIGLRTAIELVMGGHVVTIFEKRRELKDADGNLTQLGFTNRINRPHMWPFVRNDLQKLNGKEFMSREAAYPVFTEPETSSIGIDELQLLLLKNALLLGVDFRMGVGYDNAKVRTDPTNLMPTWEVECSYDAIAAEKYGKQKGKNKETFDCLVGADGPRSTVRDTQQKHFGNIEKRKFMDCVGIVANVRKVPRKRLKELGFEYGQEPSDMNRSKMVFKDFFKKIANEADADIESLIYYKASFHNYTILVPKRQDLIKHGLSGKVYHFAAGRDKAADAARSEEKAKLKKYCGSVLKAAGIPMDENAENGGFVNAPNDCMAFDFAECWNTKRSLVFNLPPPGYDVEVDGPWMGRGLVPLVCLVGDALLEPFWPLGLGLKRGWQAVMDTCYAIDNLYSREKYAVRMGKDPETFAWEDHYEAHKEQCANNFEFCSRLKIADDVAKGEYDPKGVVLTQLMKKYKDAEKPILEIEVDPWVRYQPLAAEAGDKWKTMSKDDKWLHPRVRKAINMAEYYNEVATGGKTGEIKYEGKELLSISGKVLPGRRRKGSGGGSMLGNKPAEKRSPAPPPGGRRAPAAAPGSARQKAAPAAAAASSGFVNPAEMAKLAKERQQAMSAMVMNSRPQAAETPSSRRPSGAGGLAAAAASVPRALAPASSAVPAGLSPAQEAELTHVRSMIQSISASLDAYRKAEQEILERLK